jgi:hypothetical protein
MPVEPESLAASLSALHRDADPEPEPFAALKAAVDGAHRLFGLSGAGMMLRDQEGTLRYVVASSETGKILEQVQEDLGIGPCIDCVLRDRVVDCEDIMESTTWPGVGERVGHEVRAILGVPVRLWGAPVGSLNVYLDRPHAWDDSDRRATIAYAEVVEQILVSATVSHKQSELVGQLQYALDHRVLIERAVGFLMGRLSVDEVAAFEALRRSARTSRRRIVEVAQQLLADGKL